MRVKNAFTLILFMSRKRMAVAAGCVLSASEGSLALWRVIVRGVLAAITALFWHFRERRYLLAGAMVPGTLIP